MLQISYISTARPEIGEEEVLRILMASRRNNARDRITGVLMFTGKRFLQVLEGSPDLVESAYARITADPRHLAVVKLSERTIDAREFGDWAMAYEEVGRADLVAQVDALVKDASPNIRAQFESFARLAKAT